MFGYSYDASGIYTGRITLDANPRPDPNIPDDDYLIPANCTTVAPPTFNALRRPKWNGTAWELVKAPAGAPTPPELSPEEQLALEREAMQPYARAFFAALAFFPAPGFLHMLDQYTQQVAAAREANAYDPLVIWDQRVTIVLRAHPDMEAFRLAFNLDPLLLDLIFRAAILLEAGADQEDVADFVTAGLLGLAG
jgi:hypothetical protein